MFVRRTLTLLLVVGLAALVAADTEIRNLHLPLLGPFVQPTGPITLLSADERQLTLRVSSAEPELWVALSPSDDYAAWTARLSWQASTPTRFEVDVHPAPVNATAGGALLHVRAAPLSPRMPHPLLARLGLGKAPSPPLDSAYFDTPFVLVFEPLLLGAVPRTAVPAVVAMLLLGGAAALLVPHALRALDRLVAHVHAEEADAGADEVARGKSE